MIKNIEIQRDGDKFLVSWEGSEPVMMQDELEGIEYNAANGSTSAMDIYEVISLVVGLFDKENIHKINWEKLALTTLYENSAIIDDDWETVSDFCKARGIKRNTVYRWLREGKIEKMKFGKFTLVREIEAG